MFSRIYVHSGGNPRVRRLGLHSWRSPVSGEINTAVRHSNGDDKQQFQSNDLRSIWSRFSHRKIIRGEHTLACAPNFISRNSKAFIYKSDLFLQAPLPKVRPYGAVGVGAIFTWSKDQIGRLALGDIGSKFAINEGGGVKIFPAGPVGVRFDIRSNTLPSAKFNLPASFATQTLCKPRASRSIFSSSVSASCSSAEG